MNYSNFYSYKFYLYRYDFIAGEFYSELRLVFVCDQSKILTF
jgi:hypothetical protein